MQDFNDTIEEFLLNKQRQIESQLNRLENEDPVLLDTIDESPELGTDSWKAEVHATSVVLKNNLMHLSSTVKTSLAKLRKGTYGQCDKCGKDIEAERLKIIPTATACAVCLSLASRF